MLKAKYAWHARVPGIVPDERIYEHILKNRGIDDADRFFGMGKEALHDPFRLSGMKDAVARIRTAIGRNEKILIYGDYDCDGITAISVLYRALRKAGANVDWDLPDRFSEGYGLNMNAVGAIAQAGVGLVVTVDNGVSCDREIAALSAAGIDTIVTDHHETKGSLPAALAIVHAKLSPDYPWKDLAGVAVAYKLAAAVTGSDLDDLLDLVMIGTIADLMPLDDENQALVNLGLKRLKDTRIPGLRKLLQYSHLDQVNETAIAFKIAPKINSSGRLGKARDAVRLLVSDDEEEVSRLIGEVEASHVLRKDLTEESYVACERLVDPTKRVQVLAARGLHEGVIGICAQKIAEKYQKTTVVINLEDGVGKGSMRAFGDDNVLTLLDGVADLLVKYGGHSQAAGLTVPEENIPALRERLGGAGAEGVPPRLDYDMAVKLSTISVPTVKRLEKYSFFTATFLFSDLSVVSKQTMAGKHAKFVVTDGIRQVEAVVFNDLDLYYNLVPGDRVSIVGGLSINSWKNRESIQIMIRDLECRHFQLLDYRDRASYLEAVPHLADGPGAVVLDDGFVYRNRPLSVALRRQSPGTVVLALGIDSAETARIVSKEGLASWFRVLQKRDRWEKDAFRTQVGAPAWLVEAVLAAFCELGFAEADDASVAVRRDAPKRNLTESERYRDLVGAAAEIARLTRMTETEIRRELTASLEA
ncbi:MAG: single-stranded-DNA-specific exonuclease RecJ [Candidatus Izemoplasmatales bacterium]